jgi:hypothetical protein
VFCDKSHLFGNSRRFCSGSRQKSISPDFTARDLNGNNVQLKKLLETGPVLIDFLTLWRAPELRVNFRL